jgi:arylsulfatase A-like enzyme
MPENDELLAASHATKEKLGVSRRSFLKAGAAAGGLSVLDRPHVAAALEATRAMPGVKKPNILFIISDQFTIDAISSFSSHFQHPAYGGHWASTPNLDRLARESTAFMESNSANPVCCPSRSCIFTGRMAIETGVVTNNIGIDKRVPNMGQWFEQNTDYRRVYCGKWHAGGKWNYPDVSGPRKIPGFETLPVGGSGLGVSADPQVSSSVASFIANDRGNHPYLMVASLMNPHDICYWTMALDGAATTAEADVNDLQDQLPVLPPNHIYNFTEPHGEAPYTEFHGDTQWRNYTYDYYRMVEMTDENVGRIMDAVRERNEDTVVIFISDHGEGLGRHSKVQKWHPYESSVKVPFIIWNPKRIKAGILDTEHMVSGVDVMPTLCSYAGIDPPPHQRGMNLRPIVDREGPNTGQWRREIYVEWQVTGRIIRTRKYKYAMKYNDSGNFEKPFIRKDDGSYVQFVPGRGADYTEDPNALLFDMELDPWETKNLIDDPSHAEIVNEHRQLLRDWEAKLIPGEHFDRD